jgi:hypothetical protein
MIKFYLIVSCLLILLTSRVSLVAQTATDVVVFSEANFPSGDTATVSAQQLQAVFPNAKFSSAAELAKTLATPSTGLLVLPYGSAFPEECWEGIFSFLQRGGNLFVIGGRPFNRSAFHDSSGWHLRDYSVRFIRALMIDQY